MTIRLHEIMNKPSLEDAALLDAALREGWQIIGHNTVALEGDIYDRFWLQSPNKPLVNVPLPAPKRTSHEVACALQEEHLTSILNAVRSGDYVVLDTETTGVGSDDEIVEIAIVDASGVILMNTLVSPAGYKSDLGTRWHGISAGSIETAPMWRELHAQFEDKIEGRVVIAYNANFDMRLIKQSYAAAFPAIGASLVFRNEWLCAMEAFASVYGEFKDGRDGYKWKKLSEAMAYYSLVQSGEHRALSDALSTLALIKAMAKDL